MQHPLWEKYNRIERRICRLKNPAVKRDLVKLLKTVSQEMAEMDKESVECRRLNRVTNKFTETAERAELYLKKVDKYLSMYSLLE